MMQDAGKIVKEWLRAKNKINDNSISLGGLNAEPLTQERDYQWSLRKL